VHPVLGGDPINCTEQLGVAGPWSERLPHFRSGFTPSSGKELQSEFFVGREDAIAAIEAVRELGGIISPLLLVCELRTIAADTLWLSPHYRRDTLAIHFTWLRRPEEVTRILARIETALAPFGPRPHWGKVFTADASTIGPEYARMAEFRRVRARLDPTGTFANDWLRERVLGSE
jgi:xylitol oxidase